MVIVNKTEKWSLIFPAFNIVYKNKLSDINSKSFIKNAKLKVWKWWKIPKIIKHFETLTSNRNLFIFMLSIIVSKILIYNFKYLEIFLCTC
jgi:hypothetical protein